MEDQINKPLFGRHERCNTGKRRTEDGIQRMGGLILYISQMKYVC